MGVDDLHLDPPNWVRFPGRTEVLGNFKRKRGRSGKWNEVIW